MNRKWLMLGLAFSSGVAMGVAASWTYLEAKANEKYRTWVELREGTEKLLERTHPPKPVEEIKEELKEDLETQAKISVPYFPPTATANRPEFELIEQSDWGNDGQNDRITLELMRDDMDYVLVMDGETVLDWRDILTPAVIEEMKGKDGLYLRNNTKGEDYFVQWVHP